MAGYITQARNNKLSDQEIKNNLLKSGWQEADLSPFFNTPQIPIPPSPNTAGNVNNFSNSLWDTFEHALLFISLYITAVALSILLHTITDKYVVNTALDAVRQSTDSQNWVIRGALAALIVAFPLFAFIFLDITKRTLANSALRNLKARKIFIYLTLVITFIIMIISAIKFVFGMLNGNITLNFLLHFMITSLIPGSIFTYYLQQIREDRLNYA